MSYEPVANSSAPKLANTPAPLTLRSRLARSRARIRGLRVVSGRLGDPDPAAPSSVTERPNPFPGSRDPSSGCELEDWGG